MLSDIHIGMRLALDDGDYVTVWDVQETAQGDYWISHTHGEDTYTTEGISLSGDVNIIEVKEKENAL